MSIILSIVFSASLVICFKIFENLRINTLHAVTVNYVTASALGFYFAGSENISVAMIGEEWFVFAFSMGIIFIVSFMAISITAQHIAISASMVASKMSLVIPVTYAIIFVGEPFTWFKFCAILLSLVGVVLTVIRKNDPNTSSDNLPGYLKILLPLVIFIGSGIVDTSFKIIDIRYMAHTNMSVIMAVCYGGALVCGIIYNGYKAAKTGVHLKIRSIVGGIILGVLNYFSFYYVLDALHNSGLDATTLFPVINTGVLLTATFAAILFFREKLSRLNIMGFIISIIAILLIAFAEKIN